LRFKVFVKHHNQKLPIGLGFGFINISDITNTTNLSSTQCIVIVNKGIKIGDLKVTIELGCNFIHFGKEFVGEYSIEIILLDTLNILSNIQ